LYFLVTGENPPDAITRMKGDTLGERLAPSRQHYSVALIEAIERSLALEETERPRDVAAWRNALVGSALPASATVSPSTRSTRVEPHVPTTMLRSEILDGAVEPSILLLDATQAREPLPQTSGSPLKLLLLVVVIAALGALLGRLPAFQETQILEGKISAATLAQLLGAIGAIGFFWLLGRGVASRFQAGGGPAYLYDLSMPIVTLLSLLIGYVVLQRPLAPVWDEAVSSIYTWCFVLGTCACAVWLQHGRVQSRRAFAQAASRLSPGRAPAVDQVRPRGLD
jgi:hypothetical protein